MKLSFVDVYGHAIGYDYDFILAEIKKKFPEAKTSKVWLRRMAYELNETVRMPARCRACRRLAESYAKVLLLRRSGPSVYRNVTKAVKEKFPERHFSAPELRQIERSLRNRGFTIPPRT